MINRLKQSILRLNSRIEELEETREVVWNLSFDRMHSINLIAEVKEIDRELADLRVDLKEISMDLLIQTQLLSIINDKE